MEAVRRRARDPLSAPYCLSLKRLISGPLPVDGPEIESTWRRYLTRKNHRDAQQLFNFYIPFAGRVVARFYRKRSGIFAGRLSEMYSDACAALWQIIPIAPKLNMADAALDLNGFRGALRFKIILEIYKGVYGSTFEGFHRTYMIRHVGRIEETLKSELGRPPDREELAARIKATSTDPEKYLSALNYHGNQMIAASSFDERDDRPGNPVDASCADPIRRLLTHEVWKIAMKGLSVRDRKIVRMFLDGFEHVDICPVVGLERQQVSKIIRRAFWMLRFNPALAKYLGVEIGPDETPPTHNDRGWFPRFNPPRARLAG